jgi:hypothetical protein
VSAFVRLYQQDKDTPLPVEWHARLLDTADRVVFDDVATVAPALFDATRTSDRQVALPLATLGRGDYLLRIDASAGGRSIRHEIRLTMK